MKARQARLVMVLATLGCGKEAAVISRDDVGVVAKVCRGIQSFNVGTPKTNCLMGGAGWVAWQVIPACRADIAALHIYDSNGDVAILSDARGLPGDPLWVGHVADLGASQWSAVPLSKPLRIAAGTPYWIAQHRGYCSVAVEGRLITEYVADNLAGPWLGPVTHEAWMVKLEPQSP